MSGVLSRPAVRGLVMVSALVALTTTAAADCSGLDQELRAAVKAGDTSKFAGLHGKLLAEPTCDGKYRARVGRVLALASLKHLQGSASEGKKPSLAELEQAAKYGQPWQVMAALGDVYYDAKSWGPALRAYEAALDDIRDVAANPKAPPRSVEERLAKRAYQAKALAPTFLASRSFRGVKSGVADPKFRNFTAESVPVPIKFAYNKSALTEHGIHAAKEILAYLLSHKVYTVTLIGHTDPRGSAKYNLRLSHARASAVKAYLLDHGYEGKIKIVAKGESHRFVPDDPSAYTQEERFAFDRRVEYKVVE